MDIKYLAILHLCLILSVAGSYQDVGQVIIKPLGKELTVSVGSSLNLTCEYTAQCTGGITYTWKKVDTETEKNIIRSGSTLSITVVKLEDEGVYICEVPCVKNIKKVTVRVYSLAEPVIEMPKDLKDNTTVAITCSVNSIHPPGVVNISWYQGDNMLFSEKKDSDDTPISFTLSIHLNKEQHHGKKIKCIMQLETLNVSKEQFEILHIYHMPSDVNIEVPSSLTEGKALLMSCTSTGYPNPAIQWEKIDQPWPIHLQRHPNGTVTGLLAPADSGQYQCTASNSQGTKSNLITLDVQYGPTNTSIISSKGHFIQEGEFLNLTCVSESHPKVKCYKWSMIPELSLPKDLTPYDGYLTIKSFHKEHEGIYECEVTHQNGKTQRAYFNVILIEPEREMISPAPQLPGAVGGGVICGLLVGGICGFLLAKWLK
ncbi:vascular cell adhesion protein 1 [Amia ocellicauda]|uniref:vascular cell adhesion protein 1 n=1 Tax=Amia ocellicauda TaxID=2972642 RepID=UPI003463ABEE